MTAPLHDDLPSWMRAPVPAPSTVSPLACDWRDALARFAAQMDAELAANAGKGLRRDWRARPAAWALAEVDSHAAKLRAAVASGDLARVREHAADVAAAAMIAADVAGALDAPAQPGRGPSRAWPDTQSNGMTCDYGGDYR